MHKLSPTRGYGLLEGFLSKERCRAANGLIPPAYRQGRILDIGCGTYPYFLLNTDFSEKYGIDKVVEKDYEKMFREQGIILINHDIEAEDTLPFDNEYFDVVTMLAVFEHIEPKRLVKQMKEIHRVLRYGGMYIMTTPAPWCDKILKFMAKLRLVSLTEIEEHKLAYSQSKIFSILQEADFLKNKLRSGYFEMFMNIWVTAMK